MRVITLLLLFASLATVGLVATRINGSDTGVSARRAFDCVLPMTVDVGGRPVVTTPTICIPGP